MLILTRKVDEELSFRIEGGPEIIVRVLDIAHKRVKIGMDAPPEVRILRKELLDRA